MPAAVAVPLVAAGIGAVASIGASKIGSNANRSASKYEYDATMKALEDAKAEREYTRGKDDEQRTYDRGQAADYRGRLQPYADAGVAALGQLSARTQTPLAPPSNGAMVQMKARNGEVRAIPAHLVTIAEQKGAVRL